ncbi:MAG: nucleotidyltransferase family protein [Bacteroidota bacterium]
MKSLNDIQESLSTQKEHLFSEYPIKSLAIFGSFARNEQNENSDIDLLVEFNDSIGSKFINLGDELEDLLGFKVDLVSRGGVKERYFQSIKSDLIYV